MTSLQSRVEDFVKSQNEAIQTKDGKKFLQMLSNDCTRHLAPASFLRDMGMPTDMTMDNAAYEAHITGQLAAIETATTTLLESVVDAAGGKATIHIANHIKLIGKEEMVLENVLFLFFNKDGTKVTKIIEFLDPMETKRYLGMLAEMK